MMIYPLSELPSIGDEVISADNPMAELEKLQCVNVVQDEEDPNIVYAYFINLDSPAMNDKEENGIHFYCMKGYSAYQQS